MIRKLIIPFIMFMLLFAACTPASSPITGSEAQPITQQPPSTPTPTRVLPTSTPPPEPTNTSRPTETLLSEPSQTSGPEATATPVLNAASSPTSTAGLIGCDSTLTPAQTEGPYYTPNTPERSNLVEAGMGGTRLLVTGKVINQDCEPMSNVMLDFWQTDDQGEYDNVGYRMRGHQFSDKNGNYRLETILPARYPGRTPHIHVKVFASDGQELLTTQIYFSGTSEEIPDGIFRPDLLARELEPDPNGRRHVEFDFVLPN
jgi:protocatechuate 3,4-dioxygenase beta subunit